MRRDSNMNLALSATAIISFIVCFVSSSGIYASFSILPLSFLLLFFIFVRILKRTSEKITAYFILIFSWLRLVIIPLLSVWDGSYADLFLEYNIGIVYKSLLLLVYEYIIVCIVLSLLSYRKRQEIHYENIELKGRKSVYVLFIVACSIVYIVWGRNLDLFDFIIKPVIHGERSGDITDYRTLIIRQIASSGIVFLFLYFVEKLRVAYKNTERHKYINLSILLAIILVCIIVGERRSNQVYVAFATIWLLIRVYPYPKERQKIVLYISLSAFGVLLMMTIYKHFNAFLYGSYIEAIQTSGNASSLSGSVLDSYFYGVKSVCKNIAFADAGHSDLKVFFYDIFRNVFGLSYLFKGELLTTVELYNNTLYFGEQTSGYLYSSIVYGYTYFGIILSPLATVINVLMATYLERMLSRCKSIEMTYIVAYVFMRFAFGMFGHFAPLLNFSSRFFIANGIIFFVAKTLSRNR